MEHGTPESFDPPEDLVRAPMALEGGEVQQAVQWAEEGCRRSGFRVRRHLELLARAYRAAGRPEEASEILGRARALAP